MKIEYRTPAGSGGWTTLADEGDTSLGNTADRISGFVPAPEQEVLVEPLFRGAHPTVKMLGNQRWAVTFTVERQHADPDTAFDWWPTHAAIFAVSTNFDLQVTQGAKVRTLGNCGCPRLTPGPRSDRSSTVTYTFTGQTYS